jgi:hypothetical protein
MSAPACADVTELQQTLQDGRGGKYMCRLVYDLEDVGAIKKLKDGASDNAMMRALETTAGEALIPGRAAAYEQDNHGELASGGY